MPLQGVRQVTINSLPGWGNVTYHEKLLWRKRIMAFFQSAVSTLQTLVIALGAGLGIWGAINLMEGYGNDNPGANAHVR